MNRFAALVIALLPAHSHAEILIGVEYAMPGVAKTFGELGVSAAKGYPDEITWGKMQPFKDAPIDFRQMDRMVKEYQDAGFKEIVIVLKAQSPWASRHVTANFAPKAEHMEAFEKWVKAVVSRYDHDGRDDMPGLKRAVRFYELGSEFSSFEPTPTADYLEMMERAYKAAHLASNRVIFMHAAFLATTVFKDHPEAKDYEKAFADAEKRHQKRILHKSLKDIRAVLDKHKFFDAVNFHALGDPYEIEDHVAWLRWEMKQRGFTKPIIISDTTPTPLIAWGNATVANGFPQFMGIVIPPVTESDRPRVVAHFKKLVDGDKETLAWTHSFIATEMVKKVVVAAEQKVDLINTSFMEDLSLFKIGGAGTGVSAWGGMADCKITNFVTQVREVKELRPSFYAIQQLQKHIKGYTGVIREKSEKNVRLYRFDKLNNATLWIAWLEPGLRLPGDETPSTKLEIDSNEYLTVETLISRANQKKADRDQPEPRKGVVTIPLSTTPVFIIKK